MAMCYFELRKQSARGTDSIAADMMRHMHARQHLGSAVIYCEQPYAMMCAARKQWLKLVRVTQNQRSATLNPDKILKFTHSITRMQHMRFTYKPPLDDPEAQVYFVDATMGQPLPPRCFTVYNQLTFLDAQVDELISKVTPDTLLVDYVHQVDWAQKGLRTKTMLEAQVTLEWQAVTRFLAVHDIDASLLIDNDIRDIDAMDDALDTLLNISHQFLRVAHEFQRAFALCRPIRLNAVTRQQYDAVVLLAHRVQALGSGAFDKNFLEMYNVDDTFFLYNHKKGCFVETGEPLAAAVARHNAAGRKTLAAMLHFQYSKPEPTLDRALL